MNGVGTGVDENDLPPPTWLDRTEFPFQSKFRKVDAGRMHFIDEGQGQPVVLVHGVPTWSFNYRHLIKALVPNYRCVAPDHLGFGLSSKPATWSYTPAALADNLTGLISDLKLQDITLVIHDWGGPIGLSYAIRYPENVKRLVVFNTWMWSVQGDLPGMMTAWLLASPFYAFLEKRFNFTARVFIPQVMGNTSSLTEAIHRHYLEPLRKPQDRGGCLALVRAIWHAGPWLDNLWQQRARIADIPVLMLWGLKDKAFTRRDLARWQQALPHSQVYTYPTAGHFPQEETPAEVNRRIIDFLDQFK